MVQHGEEKTDISTPVKRKLKPEQDKKGKKKERSSAERVKFER
jgi:hypothetical protein